MQWRYNIQEGICIPFIQEKSLLPEDFPVPDEHVLGSSTAYSRRICSILHYLVSIKVIAGSGSAGLIPANTRKSIHWFGNAVEATVKPSLLLPVLPGLQGKLFIQYPDNKAGRY